MNFPAEYKISEVRLIKLLENPQHNRSEWDIPPVYVFQGGLGILHIHQLSLFILDLVETRANVLVVMVTLNVASENQRFKRSPAFNP